MAFTQYPQSKETPLEDWYSLARLKSTATKLFCSPHQSVQAITEWHG